MFLIFKMRQNAYNIFKIFRGCDTPDLPTWRATIQVRHAQVKLRIETFPKCRTTIQVRYERVNIEIEAFPKWGTTILL